MLILFLIFNLSDRDSLLLVLLLIVNDNKATRQPPNDGGRAIANG